MKALCKVQLANHRHRSAAQVQEEPTGPRRLGAGVEESENECFMGIKFSWGMKEFWGCWGWGTVHVLRPRNLHTEVYTKRDA